MRTRKLLVAILVAALGVFALAGSASAATHPREPKGEAEEECIATLEGGGSIDDCQEAPSPIKPANNELIWGAISFVVLLLLMWKFAYPGIKKGMQDRSDRIRKSVEDADTAKAQAETELAQYRAQLADAKNESARIVEEARQQADALKREREAALQAELAAMRERAGADIEASKAQAVADLRSEVARLAIGAAEVVVQHNLDESTQTQLVENYIDQVGASAVSSQDRIDGYATALFEVAAAEGSLDEVEDELFRFARTLEGSDELRNVLVDEAIPAVRREGIVEELLGGKASPVTTSMVSFVVGAGRSRDLPAIIDQLVERAAAEKQLAVAEVRSAIVLTPDQEARLTDALNKATGKKVQLHVVVDPSVMGGLVASVGDTVIDGTVRERLNQLKSLL